MAEIPEHLLKRSKARRKAIDGDESGDAEAPASSDAAPAPAAPVPAAAAGVAPAQLDDVVVGNSKIPGRLLAKSKIRRAILAGETPPADLVAAVGGGAGGAAVAAVQAQPGIVPAGGQTGPAGHTQRMLTVVKAGTIQQTKAKPVDKIHVWPHLLVFEFVALLLCTGLMVIMGALVKAPLQDLADFNKTPNPSKAPWYFLGLQELLTMFHPMVAGVTIPGIGLFLLILAPYIDKNQATKPEDRKFAVSIFTVFLMFWAVLVIIGSFFRGPGFNFTFPWRDGVFFEL